LLTRLIRSSLLEVLGQDYIRTARAKGLSGITVLMKHALKNAAIPVVTVLGLQVGALLGGAVVTEIVFAWPGLGRVIVESVYAHDFPLVLAGLLFVAAIFALTNLAVDLAYGLLDPRISYE
ncbi:MAG: ABC transporter permease, partial [Armatimonadetes bacterium]|nr:ABC transporter permease [Armatimonadota bacterium]